MPASADALVRGGYDPAVRSIFDSSKGYPSIATALTEAWDADRASSHNHFMMGHVTEWLYQDLAGITADAAVKAAAK